MILSHTHEFIFICNGKTGTSSVEAALEPYQEGKEFEVGVDGLYTEKHVPPATLRAQLGPDVWEEYFTFAFVRNPWDWFVSQYYWNWRAPQLSKRELLRRPVTTLKEYWQEKKEKEKRREVDTFSPADIHATYDLLRRYRGIHQADSLFQYNYIHSLEGDKLVDFVGRFEQIEDDFQRAAQQIGIDASLPHWNSTSHRTYQSYYTDETAPLIRDLYAVDIDTFGYSYDLADAQSD
jgi:hypothetical protein